MGLGTPYLLSCVGLVILSFFSFGRVVKNFCKEENIQRFNKEVLTFMSLLTVTLYFYQSSEQDIKKELNMSMTS